jgi:hypothetical protein
MGTNGGWWVPDGRVDITITDPDGGGSRDMGEDSWRWEEAAGIGNAVGIPNFGVTSQAQRTDLDVVLDAARAVLSNATNNCTKALQKANLLSKLNSALETFGEANVLSVTRDGSKLASTYFRGTARPGETLSTYYSRLFGSATNKGTASSSAILSYDGVYSFVRLASSADSRGNDVKTGFFLHEFSHFATNLGDDALANLLLGPAPDPTMNASDRLSEYFNNGCPTYLGKIPPPPRR